MDDEFDHLMQEKIEKRHMLVWLLRVAENFVIVHPFIYEPHDVFDGIFPSRSLDETSLSFWLRTAYIQVCL